MIRKTLLLLALALPAVMLAPLAQAETVDEILAKHYEAMGGLAKLKALNSMRVTGTMAIGPGMEAPVTMERKRPDKRRVEFQVQGMTGIQAFDGEKAWSLMPFMGNKDPQVSSDEDNKNEKDDADFDGSLVDWKEKGNSLELMGKEPIEGADAYKVKVTKKNGNIETMYLDAETYLLVKTEGKVKRRGTEIEGETLFSDYKDVDGYMMPFTMEQGAKGMDRRQKMTFTKIELNVPLDDSRFTMPGATAASNPTASTPTDSTKTAVSADSTKAEGTKGDVAKAADKKTATKAAKATKKKDQNPH
jgi:outer membrane lipoprotein-sorting protein